MAIPLGTTSRQLAAIARWTLVGVVVLGNFEQQAPTAAQLVALRSHLSALMRAYGVPVSRVHTHQEWDGAATACPGGRLQHYLERLRRRGGLG